MHHSSGNYIITGSYNNDLRIVAINPLGDSIWSRTYTLTAPAKPVKTIEASDGRLVTLTNLYGNWGTRGYYAVVFDSLDLTPNAISSLKSDSKVTIDIYPNPSKGLVNVKIKDFTSNMDYKLDIYNSTGQIVRHFNIKDNVSEFNLEGLMDGVYFLRVSNKNKLISHSKLVLKN